LFAEPTRIRIVFVDGRRYEPAPEESRPRQPPQVNLSGRWSGSIDAPSGKAQVTFQFTQSGNDLAGTATSAMNTAAITDGIVSGTDLRLRAPVRLGERSVTLAVSGTATNEMLKGKVTLGSREVDFTATRTPGGTP